MSAAGKLNKNNSAVKRIMQEARELANDPCTDYHAAPLEDDIFEWHCTLRGPGGTEFEGGLYHFRILLPAEYPFRPPSIMMMTPNGRFEINTKICISFTSYHEELWQPAWGVRTAIIGLQGFFPLRGQAAVGVGSIESPTVERKRLAALSREWVCPQCKMCNTAILPDPVSLPVASTSSGTPDSTDATITTLVPESKDSAEPPLDISEDASRSQRPISPLSNNPAKSTKEDVPSQSDLTSVTAATVIDTVETPPSPRPSPTPTTTPIAPRPSPTSDVVNFSRGSRRSSQKPPLLLDTAIMILLVLLFAIICRRMV